MKWKIILSVLLAGILWIPAFAQVPGNAEDISPLLYGEKIPEIPVTAVDGSRHTITSVIDDKPSILLFYRGGWCPYCNTHLAEIQEIEEEIIELGYQIIAISPDSPENLNKSAGTHKLSYELYSDGDGSLSKAMGIVFKAPERNANRLLESSGGLNEGFLPVPSVFVVDTSGKIVFEYINPDYKTRIRAELLIAVLKVLKNDGE
ncbi:MAG: AhpC/TSA family protein [Cyclobacteriaceae bacterium]|nr:AhpC/TSA family protein [Cyclobacteriaceae bacterium]